MTRFELFGSSQKQFINNSSSVNPDNLFLEAPHLIHTLELRPDFQWQINEKNLLVIRSRHLVEHTETAYDGSLKAEQQTEGLSDLTDFYLATQIANELSTTIGLQNYQWGPAEIMSPSNVFFHFNNQQRGFFYKEKGRVLIRANWNPTPKWTVILISEPTDNRTEYWIAEQEFEHQTAIKLERQFANPANSWSAILGHSSPLGRYVGTHFSWSPTDALSIYGDARVERNAFYYRPVEASPGVFDLDRAESVEEWEPLAVVGIRWEGRVDFRQEFIWNEMGFTKKEWEQSLLAATTLTPNIFTNLQRFARSGQELRSELYSYTSLRIPDLGKSQQIHLAARYLQNLVLNSSALQLNYEHDWNDYMVLSAEASVFLGDKDTEFTLIQDSSIAVGFKVSF